MQKQSGMIGHVESPEDLVRQFPSMNSLLFMLAGVQSLIGVPLLYRNRVIGSLQFRSKTPNAYTEQDLRLAERIGTQIAGAIGNANLFADLQKVENTLRESESRFRALVERAAEARRELEGAESEQDSAREDRHQREADLQRSREAFEMAGRRLEEARRRAQGTVRDSSPAVAYCDPEAAQALVAFSDALEGIEAGVPVDPTALQENFGILRAALTDAALVAGRDEALADGASRRLSDEAATKEREADVVRERAEVLPEIPQYEELLAVLQEKAPGAIPLYRLLELSPELPESAGSAVECFLGPRILGPWRRPRQVMPRQGLPCSRTDMALMSSIRRFFKDRRTARRQGPCRYSSCRSAMKKRGVWPCPT